MKPSRSVPPLVVGLALAFAAPVLRAADDTAAAPIVEANSAAAPDRAPEPSLRVRPVLPSNVAPNTVGEAVIAVVVDARGAVTEASIKSATQPALGTAALIAVTQWKFSPGLKAGAPVELPAEITIKFPLPEGIYVAPAAPRPPAEPARGTDSAAVFDAAKVDRLPQVIDSVTPSYPFELKRRGIQGRVVVEFIVDPDGRVRDARVVRSTHPDFEKPALAAIVKWRFAPGLKAGKPVHVLMQLPIGFLLGP